MARTKRTSPSPADQQRSAAYIRVSRVGGRGEDDGEFLSPSLQREAAVNLSRVHGWQFDDELTTQSTDLDVSGRQGNLHKRQGLTRLIQASREGRVQHVIVYKLSRLARNAREGLEIFDTFERLGVAVHVVKEGIDSSTATGRMIRTMLLGVAEMQSEDISQFAQDAARQRALKGKPHQVPGWIRKGAEGAYELNPEIAPTVRRLVELRLSGASYSAIARELNNEGHVTPTGKKWRATNVAQSLDAEMLQRLRGHSVFGTHLPHGDPNRIDLPDAFPALLTPDEHKNLVTVQRTLANTTFSKSDGDPAATSRRYAPLLGSGLLTCAICASKLATKRQTYKTKTGEAATSYVCSGAGELNIPHPTSGRAMIVTTTGERDQRQMSLACEMVDPAILLALTTLADRIIPDSIPEKSIYGKSIYGKSIYGKPGYGKPSGFGLSVDGQHSENQAYTRAHARSSSSSISLSLESETYKQDDDDTLPKTRARARRHRNVEAITREIDDLFDLRSKGRITDGDFDRRYQKLVTEREESAKVAAELQASETSAVGVLALKSAVSADIADNIVDSLSLGRWRLALQLLFEKITLPYQIPDDVVPKTGDHNTRARRERRAMACWLRTPLPTGEVVVVSGLYRRSWTRERYCEILTQQQFEAIFHRKR